MEDVIDRLIVECDRKITRALKRLEEDDAKAAIAISVAEVTQVYDLGHTLISIGPLARSPVLYFKF